MHTRNPPLGQASEGDGVPAPANRMMDNEVFSNFLLYSTMLVIKMYLVAVITGQVRLRKKAFANPEDALKHGGLQYCRIDHDVERCRRDGRERQRYWHYCKGFFTAAQPIPGVGEFIFQPEGLSLKHQIFLIDLGSPD
ncbi:prostaglandin E synthase isoform X3 [Petaurus breviceps papuanus]|uniref:prostaglandin E synthase isoform X3 n=1 Tax=Petaurus breviceps papuanus TaxID=3040969 RepID=UPI0036D9DD97